MGDTEGTDSQEKARGRLATVRYSVDDKWMSMSQDEKQNVATKYCDERVKKAESRVEKAEGVFGRAKDGWNHHVGQLEYYRLLTEKVIMTYNEPKDIAQSLQPRHPIREIENDTWDMCTNVENLHKKYKMPAEKMRPTMYKTEPNSLLVVCARIYQAIWNPTGKFSADVELPEGDATDTIISKEHLRAEQGDILCVVRGDDFDYRLCVVLNVVLSPLALGLLEVASARVEGGWTFRIGDLSGPYVRERTIIVGRDRGAAFGDFWGYNVAVAGASATVGPVEYAVRESSFIMRDVVSSGDLPVLRRSQPPEPPAPTAERASSSRDIPTSEKISKKAIDLRRRRRSRLDFCLGGGFPVGEGPQGGVGAPQGGVGEVGGGVEGDGWGDEVWEEGDDGGEMGVGGGSIVAVHQTHEVQAANRKRLDVMARGLGTWIHLSVVPTTAFDGVFPATALSGLPCECWGLQGVVGPRTQSSWLRCANLHPKSQKRCKFIESDESRNTKVIRQVVWGLPLVAAWLSLRVDQRMLRGFQEKLEKLKDDDTVDDKTCATQMLAPRTPSQDVKDQWREFTTYLELYRNHELVQWGKETLGYCVAASDAVCALERDQWDLMEDAVEEMELHIQEFDIAGDDEME